MGIFDGLLGPALDIGKAIAGNMFAEEQQTDSQQFNAEQAAKAQTFNAAEAEKQRAWTRLFRGSTYQDTVHDLEAANLNPMLAVYHGGSAGGAGAAASQGGGSAGIASPITGQSVAAGIQSASQVNLNEALEERTRAEAAKVEAEKREIEERTPTHAVSRDQMQQQIRESIEKTKLLIQETSTSAYSAAHLDQQAKNLRELIPQIRATVQNLKAQTTLAGAHTTLAGAETAKAQAITDETRQRIQANLPALEAALKNLDRVSKDLSMPQRQQDASVHDSFLGSLSAVIRSLTGLGSLAK